MDDYKIIIEQVSLVIRSTAHTNFSELKNKNTTLKKDSSFVTDFDIAIDDDLKQKLLKLFPDINLFLKNLNLTKPKHPD